MVLSDAPFLLLSLKPLAYNFPMDEENQPKKKDFNPTFLGFTIYDFIHLLCSTSIMITAFVHQDAEWTLEVTKASSEIAFSLLLMAFIISMVKTSYDEQVKRRAYSFAWLTASAGTSLSGFFMVPYVLTESQLRSIFDVELGCFLAAAILTMAAFVLFFVGLFISPGKLAKHIVMCIGMALMLAAVPASVIGECLFHEDPLHLTLAISVSVAPVFMIVAGGINEIKNLLVYLKQ